MTGLFVAENLGLEIGGKALVRDASLTLAAGETTIIIGPNGAGKSTLMKLLSGEFASTSGHVRSLGSALGAIPPWRLACRRAVMAQASRLTFPFRVYEVVRLGMEGIGRAKSRVVQDTAIARALDAADMLDFAEREFHTLSGGEQQRVHFARTLCQLDVGADTEPVQALFLDEPIASLDLCHQIGLIEAARRRATGGRVAILAVLHDLNLAARFADRLVVMDRGSIIASGTPCDVLTPALIRAVFRVEARIPEALVAFGPMVLPQFCVTSP